MHNISQKIEHDGFFKPSEGSGFMAEKDKRYYWLKLKRDFFKRHDILIIESIPNGKDYILFYLKLLCESVDHEGNLRFSEQIPYNEQMLATITNTNVDIVRSAIKVFTELQMMELLDDGTYFMNEVQRMVGSAVNNDNANRQRRYRERQKQLSLQKDNRSVTKNNESKSIELDIELEKDKEKDKEQEIIKTVSKETVCQTQDVRRVVEEWNTLTSCGVKSISKLTSNSQRYQRLLARINQYGIDKVLEAINKVRESDFLQGKNNKGWLITFDWFVLPNNFIKVLDGNYDRRKISNGRTRTNVKSDEEADWYAEELLRAGEVSYLSNLP